MANNVKQGEFCQILDTLRSHTKLMASLLSKRCYVNAFETPVIWIVLKHHHFCLFKVVHEIQCMANCSFKVVHEIQCMAEQSEAR